MEKRYISVDIEASGPTPGKYSMLSLGACMVGDISVQFYKEIKPISRNFDLGAVRVAARGLKCIDSNLEELNPQSDRFNPDKVLDVLCEKGEEPEKVMEDYADWIVANTIGFNPVEAAAPIKFDGMFTAWYFDNFYTGKNPFGHSGEDMNSLYRGVTGDITQHFSNLGRRHGLPHNALDDAIDHAIKFAGVLELLRTK